MKQFINKFTTFGIKLVTNKILISTSVFVGLYYLYYYASCDYQYNCCNMDVHDKLTNKMIEKN